MRTPPRDTDWMPSGGRWWRFDKYEIRGGALRPAPSTQLKAYDPWKRYLRSRTRGQETLPPYAEFVNLRQSLSLGVQESEAAILEWCSRYGLPGMLLHQTRSVTLAPRWVTVGDKPSLIVPGQVQYVRTNNGWAEKRTTLQPVSVESSFNRPELEGSPVPEKEAPGAWARAGVLRQSLRSPEHSNERLRETYGSSFPTCPKTKPRLIDTRSRSRSSSGTTTPSPTISSWKASNASPKFSGNWGTMGLPTRQATLTRSRWRRACSSSIRCSRQRA